MSIVPPPREPDRLDRLRDALDQGEPIPDDLRAPLSALLDTRAVAAELDREGDRRGMLSGVWATVANDLVRFRDGRVL